MRSIYVLVMPIKAAFSADVKTYIQASPYMERKWKAFAIFSLLA